MFNKGSYIKKDGERRKVLEELGDIRFISFMEETDSKWEATVYPNPYTIQELEHKGWVEEAQKWEPKLGDMCWSVLSDGSIDSWRWLGGDVDKKHLAFGNCFPTREAAEAARDRIKEMLKK